MHWLPDAERDAKRDAEPLRYRKPESDRDGLWLADDELDGYAVDLADADEFRNAESIAVA